MASLLTLWGYVNILPLGLLMFVLIWDTFLTTKTGEAKVGDLQKSLLSVIAFLVWTRVVHLLKCFTQTAHLMRMASETLLQEHLLTDVIIEDIEPLLDIKDQVLTRLLVEEGCLRVGEGILKTHEVEDFSSLGINNALIPILRVEDLDGGSALLDLKKLAARIDLKLFEVDFNISNFVKYLLSSRFLLILRLVLMVLVAPHGNTEIILVEWVRIEGLVMPLRVVVVAFVQGANELPLLLRNHSLGGVLPVGALVAIDFAPCVDDAQLDHLGEILVKVEVLLLIPLEGVNEGE